jgi:hypothetical protein
MIMSLWSIHASGAVEFRLVINYAARVLGLTIPPSLLASTDAGISYRSRRRCRRMAVPGAGAAGGTANVRLN